MSKTIHRETKSTLCVYSNEETGIELCLKYTVDDPCSPEHVLRQNVKYCDYIIPTFSQPIIATNGYYTLMPKMKSDLESYWVKRLKERSLTSKAFLSVFNKVLKQLQDIHSMEIPSLFKRNHLSCVFYGDLKMENILVDYDYSGDNGEEFEIFLGDIETIDMRSGKDAILSHVPPEVIFQDSPVMDEENNKFEFRYVDVRKKKNASRITSFLFGGFLIELLFPEFYYSFNGYNLNTEYKMLNRHYRYMKKEEKKKILYNKYIGKLSVFREELRVIFGDDIANLLNDDPEKRPDIMNVKLLDIEKDAKTLDTIDEIFKEGLQYPKILKIHKAVDRFDCDEVLRLLKDNPDLVIQTDEEGNIPLYLAMTNLRVDREEQNEHLDKIYKIIDMLIDDKLIPMENITKSINYSGPMWGVSPIYSACENRETELLKKFLELGGDVNFVRKLGNVSLIRCAKSMGIYDLLGIE